MTNTDNLTNRKAGLSEAKRTLLLKRLRGKTSSTHNDGAIPSRTQPGPLPLSYTQQRIWFLQKLFPDNRAYNMHEAWSVKGSLDVAALKKALNAVARRQASLRTRFVSIDNAPMQIIGDAVNFDVPVTDITHLSGAAQGAKLQALIEAEGKHVFNLSAGPLVRLALIRLHSKDHVLLFTLHHIITDEWSIDIFWRELNTEYGRALGRSSASLPALPIQYSDYAHWQRGQVASGALERQMSYWQAQLSGELPMLQLPFDRPRPSAQSLRGGLINSTLPGNLLEGLHALSQSAGTTLYMTLLATFQALLQRYSNQDDILVGTPIANRQRPETKDVMGIFINTAVMRADLSGNPSFLELLDQVRQTALDALANQDLPFDLLVQAMHPERDLSYNPVFQTMFVYLSNNVPRTLPDLEFEPIWMDTGVAKFDLTLFAGEENGRLIAAVEYSEDLFDRSTVERILGHWETLLHGIVADPHAPVKALPLLSVTERKLVLETWNNTEVNFSEKHLLHKQIGAQAARAPQSPAVITAKKRLTYGELDAQANYLAHVLVQRGVKPGEPVGLYVERSAEMLVGILGILKAGGAYVPLEPGYPAERIAFALADTEARLVVTQSHLRDSLPFTQASVVTLDSEQAEVVTWSNTAPEINVTHQDLAYIIHTSGSTGAPKGVMVTHGNLLASTLARTDYYATPVQRFLLLSSFAFDSSVAGLFWTLANGGALVLPAPDEEKDVQQLATLIAKEQVTHTLALPTLYRLLLTYAPANSLDSLQVVIVAGEACPPDLGELHYESLPGSTLYNEYGPTEATVWCSVYRVPGSSGDAPVPIGRPIANSQLYIFDPHQQPMPIGVAGELYVGGDGVTPGYWRNPTLTNERFPTLALVGYPEIGRVYRTGDLARWRADGQIEFLGRVDNQVKIRGFRIELGEIEAVLLRHPSVQEAAVTVWEQTENGAGADKRLIAYVGGEAFAGNTQTNGAQIHDYLGKLLPDYMTPSQIITLPALPHTPNGKIDRKQLPPPRFEVARKRPFVPPRTPTEETLARIWCEILQLPEVSVQDKFFELGGDSIMSIRVIARARQEGLLLTPPQLFKAQTIARLAALAAEADDEIKADTDMHGPAPLTPIQHWFFEQRLHNPAHWNQAVWFETTAQINTAHLNAALTHLVQRHPMLRARYQQKSDGWQQTVSSETQQVAVEYFSLADLEPDAQDVEMLARANKLHAALDLVRGPLLRAALFDLGPQRPPRLLLTIHHLVVDAVSWGIIEADLAAAYRQINAGQAVALPAPTTSYAQWSRTLEKLARGDALRQEAGFWRQSISQQPLLPKDSTGSGNMEGEAGLVMVTLDEKRTAHLLRDAHQAYHTRIDDLLLTALARAVAGWSGGSSLLLTLERHGREALDPRLDLTQVVGWFTALVPVLLTLDLQDGVGRHVRAVKEQLRRIPQNGIGYSILRYLGDADTRQRLAALPQPEILFNYLGQIAKQGRDALLWPLTTDPGQVYGPQNARVHLIDVNAWVEKGCLTVKWQYAPAYFQATTITSVAENYITELTQVIEHCMDVDQSRHTPSDFPLTNLQQDDLDSLSGLLAQLD